MIKMSCKPTKQSAMAWVLDRIGRIYDPKNPEFLNPTPINKFVDGEEEIEELGDRVYREMFKFSKSGWLIEKVKNPHLIIDQFRIFQAFCNYNEDIDFDMGELLTDISDREDWLKALLANDVIPYEILEYIWFDIFQNGSGAYGFADTITEENAKRLVIRRCSNRSNYWLDLLSECR